MTGYTVLNVCSGKNLILCLNIMINIILNPKLVKLSLNTEILQKQRPMNNNQCVAD